MSNHDPIVFVLGAGFSAAAGHPLMAEFGGVLRNLARDPTSRLDEQERERFERVLRYQWEVQRVYSYLDIDLENLEHLFGLIDMDASLANQDSHQLRDDLVFALVRTIELTRVRGPGLDDQVAQHVRSKDYAAARSVRRGGQPTNLYTGFAKQLAPHDAVITFNYDTVLEDVLLSEGIGPSYGFAEPPWFSVSRRLPLLKLHGSCNFIELPDGSVEVLDHEFLEQTTVHYYARGRPLLIPPTWNKGSLSGTIQQIWYEAAGALARASQIAFIGYSLPETDLSFRFLLARSLSKNADLRMVTVVDPSSQTLSRYQAFISTALKSRQRFRPLNQHFPASGVWLRGQA